jgi:transposase
MIVDGTGIPLAATTTKANVHDLLSALPTIDRIVIGRRKRRPKRIRADKGYDSVAFRKALRQRRIKPAIDHREYQNRKYPERMWNDAGEIRYGRNRWRVEQRFACLDQNRRLDFLFERTRTRYETFLKIAFIRCYLKILSRSYQPFRRVWR